MTSDKYCLANCERTAGIYAAGFPQYVWLMSDLAGLNYTRTPWIIAVLHTPW